MTDTNAINRAHENNSSPFTFLLNIACNCTHRFVC